MSSQVFFVGTNREVAHHAAPFNNALNYQIIEPDAVVNHATAGDLAIFFSEHFDRFRNAIHQLREKRVATLYMIDGILEWRNAWENRGDEPACPFTMRPVLSDKVACIGPSQYRVLQNWGNNGKVELVGIPRLEPLKNLKKRQRDASPFRVMIATAKCPSYTENDRANLHRCLIDLKNHTDAQGIEVIWRLTAGLEELLGVKNNLANVSGQDLADQLANVDALITTPSTTILESMLLDLPTAVVDYNNCPGYLRTAWSITSESQIETQIKELSSPPESKMMFQRQSLVDSLYLESNATNRMLDLIDHMQSHAERTNSLNFPANLLANSGPSVPSIGFNSAAAFPEYDEFKSSDLTMTQTELAHSRREIEHLQSEIRQLKSELGEAHQIFDEINSHPIAGPIVKVRQKLLETIQKFKESKPRPETNSSNC